ncbi:hypothetical protein DsansV1_C06g0060101 [Dioscorea sansibarensis]
MKTKERATILNYSHVYCGRMGLLSYLPRGYEGQRMGNYIELLTYILGGTSNVSLVEEWDLCCTCQEGTKTKEWATILNYSHVYWVVDMSSDLLGFFLFLCSLNLES